MVNKNYQKHKERLQKEARENGEKRPKKDIKVLLEKKKEKRRQYYQEHKRKLPEYRRNYYSKHKK